MTEDMLERTKLVQAAMVQFEIRHNPYRDEDGIIQCQHCVEDWPCTRMQLMMLIQGFAALQAMMPSGNVGALLSRFSGGLK